jgi:hypothetical protein
MYSRSKRLIPSQTAASISPGVLSDDSGVSGLIPRLEDLVVVLDYLSLAVLVAAAFVVLNTFMLNLGEPDGVVVAVDFVIKFR